MDPLLMFGETSKRLRFRKLVAEDFEAWKPLFYEKESAENLGLDTSLSPEKLCEAWFNKSNWRYDNNLGGMNVIVDKNTNEFIGQCGLLIQEMEGKKWVEVGYSILPKYWRQGYASESAKKCRDFAFEKNLSDQLISVVYVKNEGSANVARNNGMSIIKENFTYLDMQVNVFGINRNDWLQIKK